MRLESLEKKVDFFTSKQFAKESSSKDSIQKFVKKIFIKRTQDFDKETILIFGDTITYSLQDPKKFANFKKMLETSYKRLPDNESRKNTITYKKKLFTVTLTEQEVSSKDLSARITLYNFSIVANNLK